MQEDKTHGYSRHIVVTHSYMLPLIIFFLREELYKPVQTKRFKTWDRIGAMRIVL